MFRSYRDLVRKPKEADKSPSTEVYHCDMCDKGGWPSENDVEIHKRDSHSAVLLKFRAKHKNRFCTVCMTLHDSNEALVRHIKSQHLLSSPNAKRVERVIYICDVCTNIFFNRDVLETHILYAHMTKKFNRRNTHFTCPKCSKRNLLKSIWFHFLHHEIPSVSLCDICLCNFPNRAELHKHIKTHPGYYKCEPCGYSSTKDYLFESHIKKHSNRVVPSCKSPDVSKVVFKKHKGSLVPYNIHNAIKGLNLPNFIEICTLCREICSSQTESRNHVLRDHIFDDPEKKKHLCVCGEEFYYKVVLKQHVLKMKGSHRALEETSVPTNEETWNGSGIEFVTITDQNIDSIKSNDLPEAHETPSVVYDQTDDADKIQFGLK